MKVYACPEEVPAPEFDWSNGHFDLKKMIAAEETHSVRLKAHLRSMGYTGEHTGEELQIPHADGAARYMFADAGAKSCLIHLPYGDAWNSPHAKYMPKKEVLRRIAADKGLRSIFAAKE